MFSHLRPPRSFSSLDEAEVKGEVRQVDRRSTGECISDFLHDHLKGETIRTLLGPKAL